MLLSLFSFLMCYAAGFSRTSITVKVLCLLRVKYIFKYFKLFFPCFPGLPCLSCFPSRLSLALPSLALLVFPLGANQKTLCGLLARQACALSCFPELPGLPAARLMSKHKKAGVLPPAFALILFAFSGLQPSI
jgi:hypothetical protein